LRQKRPRTGRDSAPPGRQNRTWVAAKWVAAFGVILVVESPQVWSGRPLRRLLTQTRGQSPPRGIEATEVGFSSELIENDSVFALPNIVLLAQPARRKTKTGPPGLPAGIGAGPEQVAYFYGRTEYPGRTINRPFAKQLGAEGRNGGGIRPHLRPRSKLLTTFAVLA